MPLGDHSSRSRSQSFTSGPATPGAHAESTVWTKTLEITKTKLSENGLPSLTSQSSGKDIWAVIDSLNALQKDDEKKRWSYTWGGKEILFVDCVRKILKPVQHYAKIVDTMISSDPQVAALVWGGISAIIQVRISYTSLDPNYTDV